MTLDSNLKPADRPIIVRPLTSPKKGQLYPVLLVLEKIATRDDDGTGKKQKASLFSSAWNDDEAKNRCKSAALAAQMLDVLTCFSKTTQKVG